MGGWGEVYPSFFGIFLIFFNFAKPVRAIDSDLCSRVVSNVPTTQ